MAVGQEPFDVTAYKNRLYARQNTPKDYLILHISYLEEQMRGFIVMKNRLAELQTIIGRFRRAVDLEIFKEELKFLKQRSTALFQVSTQANNVPINVTDVTELVDKVRVVRNLIYHHAGLDTDTARDAKHAFS
jgi:hypothetical protein